MATEHPRAGPAADDGEDTMHAPGRLTALTIILALGGCGAPPGGLRPTPEGTGPLVYVDWDAEPLPEIPFPNDLGTRPDPGSPTGLRLNFPQDAPTELEREARRKVNELSGWGIFSPITVRFTAPLDLGNLLERHDADLEPDDDAVYVFDVSPTSPNYLQAVELDLGHGRFPADVVQTDRYFPNDPRADSPSVLYETVDEDVNGNGELDPGEDTDGDGVLDVANLWPGGSDPRQDLMEWYDRETDTLILRPVVPLREETRYAVVLTSRLRGADGERVRSPWAHVNHTRQTDALWPVLEALADVDLTVDDVDFAWVFTTARVTGDLVDLRRGLDGQGPFPNLGNTFPAGVWRASEVHDIDGVDNVYALPVDRLLEVLLLAGLLPESAREVMEPGYALSSHVVGGVITTPFLLADRDDDGRDTSEEWWDLDPVTGEVHAEAQLLNFTCVVPRADADHTQPFPVAIWGHGYGSSRFDMFNLAWATSRVGIATCAADYPGHGLALNPSDLEEYGPLLEQAGLLTFLEHLEDSRARDLDNDGTADSGADQWTADSFHTRDQVRQGALDMIQLRRALARCGTTTMGTDVDGDGVAELSCDWDGDGAPDLGGPDADIFFSGGSLGGIVTSVALAVEPEVVASAPIAGGGGLTDISLRSNLGGATEAVFGRMMTPLILGTPVDGGGLVISQYGVSGFVEMRDVPIATLSTVPAGGRVRVENLDNGEIRDGILDADGRFRVAIPADALDAAEKRAAAGIPETGPDEDRAYGVPDNEGLGDRLRITVWDADDEVVADLERFEAESTFEGVTVDDGSPLVALSSGLGLVRGTPRLRRVVQSLAMITEPGDPIAYAPHWIDDPFPDLFDGPANVLQVNTVGDEVVMINAGIALARAAGLVDRHEIDPRYGMTADDWLIARRVVHGLEEYGPYTDVDGEHALFDADDLDDGTDGTGAPSELPYRATITTNSGTSALRLPYVDTRGSHGPHEPDLEAEFDMSTFLFNQVAHYLSVRGAEVSDDPCLARNDCDHLRPVPED